MNNVADNPLLDFSDLPRFDAIEPAHVAPAIDALLKEADAALEEVTAAAFPADWSALLDVSTERLSRAWGAVSHLNSVADTPDLRAAYNEALPRVTEFWTRLGADERRRAADPPGRHGRRHVHQAPRRGREQTER